MSNHQHSVVQEQQTSTFPGCTHTTASYESDKPLGRVAIGGLNAGIYVVRDLSTKQSFVEKRLRPKDISSGHAKREIEALLQLVHHPNICRITCYTIDFDRFHMPQYEMGSLRDLIVEGHELPEDFAWHVTKSLGRALTYLAYGFDPIVAPDGTVASLTAKKNWNSIIHRDIKPENVLLTMRDAEGGLPTVVLADFGCSVSRKLVQEDPREAKASRYTRFYRVPEFPRTTSRSDVYQLGLIIQCLDQKQPIPVYTDDRSLETTPRGFQVYLHLEPFVRYSAQLENLTRCCTEINTGARPNPVEIAVEAAVRDHARAIQLTKDFTREHCAALEDREWPRLWEFSSDESSSDSG